MDENKILWKKCTEFHGHICGGLAIGYKAALYAIQLLGLQLNQEDQLGCLSRDEELVCISENDACGVDAIQVILGCSVGKGNLLFHMTGKMAFSFYNRKTGKSVRLLLKELPEGVVKGSSFGFYESSGPEVLFKVMPTTIQVPEKARSFTSYVCEECGEVTGANWIRIRADQKLCLDCYKGYDRFRV
ncbi:MAG: FmdE family protein [Lachnospiraceae bacterium]|nr:FmdE family protein [Lachnospiraceae bacterium]